MILFDPTKKVLEMDNKIILLTLTKEMVCIEPASRSFGLQYLVHVFKILLSFLLKDVFVVRLSLLEDLYCGVADLNQFVVEMLLSPP